MFRRRPDRHSAHHGRPDPEFTDPDIDPDFSDPVFTDPNWGNDFGVHDHQEIADLEAEALAEVAAFDAVSEEDLARGRALALRMMDDLDAELADAESLFGGHVTDPAAGHLRAARTLRNGWRALEHPGDLYIRAHEVSLFAAAVAQARACLVPTGPPCLFDPYHGPATQQVVWTPHAGLLPRPVRVCAEDAARLASGVSPRARDLPTLEGMKPMWACDDDVHARWMLGHFSLTGAERLQAELAGTPLGSIISLRLRRF